MRFLVLVGLLFLSSWAKAQISGHVYGIENGSKVPLVGASVHWEGTEISTQTDSTGAYTISKPSGVNYLVVQSIGYATEAKSILSRRGTVDFTLGEDGGILAETEVIGKANATTVDLKSAQFSFKLDKKELRKAACCNLSESFETNASLDVNYADAVSGTKQIEMLGQAGKFALIQRENVPYARGINASLGFHFIPGPFVESIQLTKGLSSVINGYESLTGQINVEFEKPDGDTDFFFNAYGNQGSRVEGNVGFSTPLSENVATTLLVHYSDIPIAQDNNGDGFADMPTDNLFNVFNKYRYFINDEWGGQIGFNYTVDERNGGQLEDIYDGAQPWVFKQNNERIEIFGKNGYAPADHHHRSLGLIYNVSQQTQKSTYGLRQLEAKQQSAYFNAILQDHLGSEEHMIKTGVSYQFDRISEKLDSIGGVNLYDQSRDESVPGVFAEYSYEPSLLFTFVGGVRVDYHNLFGWFVTPRAYVKYMPTEETTFRLGGGRGQRTANLLTETQSSLASSRTLQVNTLDPISPEIGWNVGFSYAQLFALGGWNGTFTTDVFYTWFEQKLITDYDWMPGEYALYYAQGSESLSFLTQLDVSPVEELDVRLAYKYLHAVDAFAGGELTAYQIPSHRAFLNAGYAFPLDFTLDATLNWFGERRLPGTVSLPETFGAVNYSPSFFTLNSQLNKTFKGGWEVYIGAENLLDFRVENPIVGAQNPWASDFDTQQVYGPIFGRMFYLGVNYTL